MKIMKSKREKVVRIERREEGLQRWGGEIWRELDLELMIVMLLIEIKMKKLGF